MTRFQPPRGMKDVGPEETALRKEVYDRIRSVLDSYGYKEVQPVEVEMFGTLAAKSGEDIRKEIYCFRDKGGRELGLRFDLSVGMARMVASSLMPAPAKLYAIGSAWRYDKPQAGRYRCFCQWDAEIFGVKGPEADAEVVALTADILREFRLPFSIKINSRKLVEGVLEYLGVPKRKQEDAMRVVDKLAKLGRQAIFREFKACGIGRVQADSIINALKRSGSPSEVIKSVRKDFPKNKRIEEGAGELEELVRLLRGYGLLRCCTIDLSIVRGIGYYTGIVFEAFVEGDRNSVAGGGRFDSLTKVYGKDLPATGIGGGIERMVSAIRKKRKKVAELRGVFVAAASDSVRTEALRLARHLRKKGETVEVDLMGRSLGKQLKYADRMGARLAYIVGEKDLKKGVVTVRDMKTGAERRERKFW